MRRAAAIVGVIAVSAVAAAIASPGGGGGGYEVRAIFGNGDFLVSGEDVRIAGATVGTVQSVDVTNATEPARANGKPDPGKAVVVMAINDPSFQDFRTDATCLIRPQSLLGEKYVECQPTQTRAPGTQPPPPLPIVPAGDPGAGQHLLPISQNGTAVDLDLVQNIMRQPYADRFRLILNELGAGLAARGKDLDAIIRRSDPALQKADELLGILARQNHALANLARQSDQVLAPLARERNRVAGFINNANVAAQAAAQRSAQLEQGIHRLPAFLRQLTPTMAALQSFADRTRPVLSDLGGAAPDLTRITRALGPFSSGATRALVSLGNAAAQTGPKLVASQPVLRDLQGLAQSSRSPSKTLTRLLASLQGTGGEEQLTKLLFFGAGSVNGYDSLGHFQRTLLPLNNCVDYKLEPEAGCDANFTRVLAKSAPSLGKPASAPVPSSAPISPKASHALLHFMFGNGSGQSRRGAPR